MKRSPLGSASNSAILGEAQGISWCVVPFNSPCGQFGIALRLRVFSTVGWRLTTS